MARRRPTNPIDPETGKRRRGRPPKKAPIDTIQDIPADDQDAIVVRPLDPREEVSTSLQEEWKRRFRGSNILEVPQELKDKYPDGQFAYARNTAECISMYRTKYGYEIAEALADKLAPEVKRPSLYGRGGRFDVALEALRQAQQ